MLASESHQPRPHKQRKKDSRLRSLDDIKTLPMRLSDDELKLSTESLSPQGVEDYLKSCGFLEPDTGIRETQQMRDPMLTILYDPERKIPDGKGGHTTMIDELLKAAFSEAEANYGVLYGNFEMIQRVQRDLIASKDIHAKQMTLLCFLSIESGLQSSLSEHYPENGREVNRLRQFLPKIRDKMQTTLNVAFTTAPNQYNVGRMLEEFLRALGSQYDG